MAWLLERRGSWLLWTYFVCLCAVWLGLFACLLVCVGGWVGVVSVVWLVRDGLHWVTRRCTYQAVREGIAHRMTIFV